jgi:hypothetical protein
MLKILLFALSIIGAVYIYDKDCVYDGLSFNGKRTRWWPVAEERQLSRNLLEEVK